MYALSGTSICQHKSTSTHHKIEEFEETEKPEQTEEDEDLLVLGGNMQNLLARINPVYNGRMELVKKAKEYYREKYQIQ